MSTLLGNPPETKDKSIKKIINSQLDIKLGQFMEEPNVGLKKKKKKKKFKAEKLQNSTKYLLKYERQENLTTYFYYKTV